MSLYKLWEKGKAPEWRYFYDFVAWVNANKYKEEYGYKGGFTPENLKLAIPSSDRDPKDMDAAELVKTMKLAELKKLADDMEIDISDAKRKEDIAKAIAEGVKSDES